MACIDEAPPRRRTRSRTISIRVEPGAQEVIDLAADALGKDRSSFMLEAARREAERVLMDRRFFALDEDAYAKFMTALDAPPADNPRLRKLLARKPVWEK